MYPLPPIKRSHSATFFVPCGQTQVSSEYIELVESTALCPMSLNKLNSLVSAASWASDILCASRTVKVGTKIETWRSFATEWLVSPSNDLHSCSFLIWSHVQLLIRFPLASLLPRLQHTSPLQTKAQFGLAEHYTSSLSLASNLLQFLFLLRSLFFRWDGFHQWKALFTGETIIPTSPADFQASLPQTTWRTFSTAQGFVQRTNHPTGKHTDQGASWPGTSCFCGVNISACSSLMYRNVSLFPTCPERPLISTKSNRLSPE